MKGYSSLYDYLISINLTNQFKKYIDINGYKFQYNSDNLTVARNKYKTVVLFGKVVNSYEPSEDATRIVSSLLNTDDFMELINESKKLAGRFLIISFSKEGLFVLPDASSSIQVAYTIKNEELFVSSNPKIIADNCNWQESKLSREIKSKALPIHALPNDLTMYDEIKSVLPNHYLNCESRNTVRFYPLRKEQSISIDDAALLSYKLLKNIIAGYKNHLKLSLPLTAGIDSRTLLAVSKDMIHDIPTYTIYHEHFNNNTADIVIPKQLSDKFGISHHIIKSLKLDDEVNLEYTNRLGLNVNNKIAKNAWAYKNSQLSEYTFMNADIVPIAKSSFGKNLPEFMSTSGYLVAKTHNHSKHNKQEIKKWIHEVKKYSVMSNISKFDLFFWEHRIGKWTAMSLQNYDLLVNSLNPYNCRELIELWLKVSRSERTKFSLHKKIISLSWPELLDIPINPDNKFRRVSNNSYLAYLMSRTKHVLEKIIKF